MESLYKNNGFEVIDQIAQDGISPMIAPKIDALNEEQFKTWCDCHYETCREKSILGASNHVLIFGKKV